MKTKIIIACFFMCIFDYSIKGQESINTNMFSAANVSLINSSPYQLKGVFYQVNDSSIMLALIDISAINIWAESISNKPVIIGSSPCIPVGIVIGKAQPSINPSCFIENNRVSTAAYEIPESFGIRITLWGSRDK